MVGTYMIYIKFIVIIFILSTWDVNWERVFFFGILMSNFVGLPFVRSILTGLIVCSAANFKSFNMCVCIIHSY